MALDLDSNKCEIVKYVGGKRHISILFKIENKYYIFYCKTGKINYKREEESTDCMYRDTKLVRLISSVLANMEIPIIPCFHIRSIEKEEFELIDEIVASLLEDQYE